MRLRALSLTTKLNLLLAAAAGVALLMACVAFVTNDIRMLRHAKIAHVAALAEAISTTTLDGLVADEPARAQRALAALERQPTIAFARLFDRHGNVVATYRAPQSESIAPQSAEAPGVLFTSDGHLGMFTHVHDGHRHAGTLYLHATLDDLHAQLLQYVRIVALIAVATLSTSVVVSSRLQRVVSAPIVELTRTAQRISAERDYSLRVGKVAQDEIGTLYDEFNAMLDRIVAGERDLQAAHDLLEARVEERTKQVSQANFKLSREITERQRAEEKVAALNEELVDAAHRAGMAEIATDVLHNVGNVLNSVNVSCTVVVESLRKSCVGDVRRVAELIEANRKRLGEFLMHDERGRQVPGFLLLVSDHLAQERAALVNEMESLSKNIEHIKTIVAMQQSHACVAGSVASIDLAELLDDAVRLNHAWIERHGIEVVRQYAPLPPMQGEKQKVLQVMINLVQNARDALIDGHRPDPRMVLRIGQVDDNVVRIEVADNGVGIAPETMGRIFAHGFTTKQAGHGFGLHSCANVAKELGGQLTAASAGLGCGATLILELPLQPVEVCV